MPTPHARAVHSPTTSPAGLAGTQTLLRGLAVLELEENEIGIRCVGVPLRHTSGQGVAAISVASALPCMSEDRMHCVVPVVRRHALALSQALGWRGDSA